MEHQNSRYTLGVTEYFELMNCVQPVSMNRFLLVLDWLFMLGKITSDSEKGLQLCI
ncbi:ABC-three component system middle component 6 [Moraxella atlantae]|uniref:ABC-three component system middle component 6 n=1 Tax=Faucicola atlantae TaxID=34059 RepID=UPI0037534956